MQEESFTTSTPYEELDTLLRKDLSNNSAKDIDLDNDVLKRWAFNTMIQSEKMNVEISSEILNKHRANFDQLIAEWQKIYEKAEAIYIDKIEKAAEATNNLKSEIEKEDTELVELERKKTAILEELKTIKERMFQIRQELSSEKKDLAHKWITEAQEEIEKMIGIQKTIYSEIKSINKTIYDDSKRSLDLKASQLQGTKQYLNARYEEVHTKIKVLGGEGVNPYIAQFLVIIGTATAGAAGYFFSVFTSSTLLSSQDTPFFLLTSFISSASNANISFLTKVWFFLASLIAITLVSWGAHVLINKYFGKKNERDFEKHLFNSKFKYEPFSYSNSLKTSNWFSLWLRIIPALLIGGIILLLLQASSSAITDANVLNASLEGLTVGTTLAMAICGVGYLYILKVVEPRMLKNEHTPKPITWIRDNWELVAVLLLFISITIIATFQHVSVGQPSSRFSNQAIILISLSEFLTTSFLAAFCFGYGSRFKGLIRTGQYLERQIEIVDSLLISTMDPEVPDVEIEYSKKLQAIANSLFEIINFKALVLTGKAKMITRENKRVPEEKKGLWDQFIGLFSSTKVGDKGSHQLFQLNAWETIYFPNYDEKMKVLHSEYSDKNEELSSVENKIREIQVDVENQKLKKDAEIESYKKDISIWQAIRVKILQIKNEKITVLQNRQKDEESDIIEGLNLAAWYRLNGLQS